MIGASHDQCSTWTLCCNTERGSPLSNTHPSMRVSHASHIAFQLPHSVIPFGLVQSPPRTALHSHPWQLWAHLVQPTRWGESKPLCERIMGCYWSIYVVENWPNCPWLTPLSTVDLFHLLLRVHPQNTPTRPGHLESSLWINSMYVNIYFYCFNSAQTSLADKPFQTLCFSPIGAGGPQDSPSSPGHMKLSFEMYSRYVTVYYYVSKCPWLTPPISRSLLCPTYS